MSNPLHNLERLIEAWLLAAGRPLTEDELFNMFSDEERPTKNELKQALFDIKQAYEDRAMQLVEVASGWRFQIQPAMGPWVAKLWEEKAPRYSKALLETLALIAYRQPITRGEIEDIRGVSLSPSIFKTLLEERDWIRVVGHREVPGRPALYATTKAFLDYFSLKNLNELPPLPEVMNLDSVQLELFKEGNETLAAVEGDVTEGTKEAETSEISKTSETAEPADNTLVSIVTDVAQ